MIIKYYNFLYIDDLKVHIVRTLKFPHYNESVKILRADRALHST